MSGDDTLIFAVGIFVSFMAIWGAVLYGILIVKERAAEVEPGLQPQPPIAESDTLSAAG